MYVTFVPRLTLRGGRPLPIRQMGPVEEASLVGSRLGDRYRILGVIGDGGMGKVFRAERLATGQTVALKLLHPELSAIEQVVQRFHREAEVTSQLSHPHIVKVVEFGAWNGRLFLATELLEGKSLAGHIEASGNGSTPGLGVRRALAVMRPVLDALAYAHRRGVVHRDLKPENIMVIPPRGMFSRECVKLLDFGIAKLDDASEANGQKLTQLGLVLGTPGYMSPEQAVGGKADARSDLYSCGVVLYEMLTGQRPFQADTSVHVLAMHLNAAPRPLRAVAPEARIPAAVEGVVLRCLAKSPGDRFQSARALRKALERAARMPDTERAGVSGVAETMLATSQAPQPGSRWSRLAVILAATGMLIADHVRHGTHARAGSHAVASSEHEPDRRPSSAVTRDPSPRNGKGAKRSRPAPKRQPQ
jgi:serine/threonine-protein kinase